MCSGTAAASLTCFLSVVSRTKRRGCLGTLAATASVSKRWTKKLYHSGTNLTKNVFPWFGKG